jgi:hypothetical protein
MFHAAVERLVVAHKLGPTRKGNENSPPARVGAPLCVLTTSTTPRPDYLLVCQAIFESKVAVSC